VCGVNVIFNVARNVKIDVIVIRGTSRPRYRPVTSDLVSREIFIQVLTRCACEMWWAPSCMNQLPTATAHQYLNKHFLGNWIGRNGAVAWPSRSPDLNHIDFYISGHVKNDVYSTHFTNFDELWERIVDTHDTIRNRPGQLDRVRDSMIRCLNECVAVNGLQFEQVILKTLPAPERKSTSRKMFTFGPMMIRKYLLNLGWGILDKSLKDWFWDTLNIS
jgi:hypothetical protein